MASDHTGQLDDVEIGRLLDTIDRALFLQRIAAAEEAATKLLAAAPASTAAWERWGDVLAARGQSKQAAQAFARAMELEPANVDAERKYAAIQLDLAQAQWEREKLEQGDLEALRGGAHRGSGAALMRAAVFPGLGQVYNGDNEKGIAIFVAAFILLIPAVRLLVAWMSPRQELSPLGEVLGYIGLLGLVGLYLFGMWDAYRAERGPRDRRAIVSPRGQVTEAGDDNAPRGE